MTESSVFVLVRSVKRSLFFFVVFFVVCWFNYDDILKFIETPLLNIIGQNSIVSLSLLNSVSVPLQLCWDLSIVLFMPYFLFEIWVFVTPALTKQEKKHVWPIFVFSWGLFFLGSVFAYYVIFPIMFSFLIKLMPAGIKLMPDIVLYVNLCSDLILTFGLCAQLPLAMVVLSLIGFVNVESLVKIRPYAIVIFFIIGMLLTPPDVISQILLALPLCILYELGVVIIKIVEKDKLKNK